MRKGKKASIEMRGSVPVLHIRGDVTDRSATPIRNVYDPFKAEKGKKLILNFDEEIYINSEGLKGIILLLAEAKENEQEMAFTGLSHHLKKVFRMVGITQFAQSFDSVDEAVKAFESSESQ